MTTADVDNIVDTLQARICPVHNTAMKEIAPFSHPDMQYIRHRFRCTVTNCRCEVHFVDDEIKRDSIARTLYHLNYVESEGQLNPQQ